MADSYTFGFMHGSKVVLESKPKQTKSHEMALTKAADSDTVTAFCRITKDGTELATLTKEVTVHAKTWTDDEALETVAYLQGLVPSSA